MHHLLSAPFMHEDNRGPATARTSNCLNVSSEVELVRFLFFKVGTLTAWRREPKRDLPAGKTSEAESAG